MPYPWIATRPFDEPIHILAEKEPFSLQLVASRLDLVRRLPNSERLIYPDSGHGAVFQFHADFVAKALEFLSR
jgi:hypothetical protein